MSEELKPCPMCGGGAAFKEDGEGGHYIECQNELCAITTNLRYACGEDPKPLLAEVWNRRAQPAQAAALNRLTAEQESLGLYDAAPSVAPEPVAWRWKYKFRDIGETGAYEYHSHDFAVVAHLPKGEPLFTHPPRAPLTDEQLSQIMESVNFTFSPTLFARAIEAAHGIRGQG